MRLTTIFLKRSLLWGFIFSGVIVVTAAVFWVSRGDWLYPEQINTEYTLDENLRETTVGQSFVSSQAGLQAVEVKLDLPDNFSGSLILHLRESPDAVEDIQQSTISISGLSDQSGWIRFPLEPLPDSHSRYYYFFIEGGDEWADGRTPIHYGAPDSYSDGSLYLNDQPQEGQLAFRLSYNRPAMLYDLAAGIMASLVRGTLVILVFTLPGWAFMLLFQLKSNRTIIRHWLEGASVAVGLSLVLYLFLFLWAGWAGLQPGKILVWVTVIVSGAFLVWHYRLWQLRWGRIKSGFQSWADSAAVWADSALIFVLFVAAAGRFLMIRGLDMPFWGDSVQHAVIVQRIIENGGLFQSWLPYSPHTTFSFHFGFHLNSAIFAWMTGLDAAQTLLWGGQLFNFFAAFTLYALAYRLKGPWAGTIAVLAAGVFLQFPMFYTNWGRYPQMMGQAILPAAAWWTWVTLDVDGEKLRFNIPWIIGGACLIAGSIFGYYRMAFHYLAFVAAAGIVSIYAIRDLWNWRKWQTLLSTAVVTIILMLPWIARLASRSLLPTVSQAIPTTGSGLLAARSLPLTLPHIPAITMTNLWPQIEAISLTWTAPQALLLLLGTAAIVWWGRKTAVPTLWLLTLMALPILKVLPLPGVSYIESFTIQTSLYMPMALIWGVVGGSILSRLSRRWQPLILLLIILLSLFRLPHMLQTIDQRFDLSARPDMRAAAWINETLPDDAFFLINGFEYKNTPAANDGGWWLPLLTKRQTTIPPQYASFVETPEVAGYRQITTDLVQYLYDNPPDSPEGKTALCNFPYPITHVYVGQKRGEADETALDHPLLSSEALAMDPAFDLVYHQDRVMIFQFDRAVCANE